MEKKKSQEYPRNINLVGIEIRKMSSYLRNQETDGKVRVRESKKCASTQNKMILWV